MSDELMLTTSDNPYNPWTDFDDWYNWDLSRYDSLSYLGRVQVTSDELSADDLTIAINQAINEIVLHGGGFYVAVPAPTTVPPSSD